METCLYCGRPGHPYCSPEHEAADQPEQEADLVDPPPKG